MTLKGLYDQLSRTPSLSARKVAKLREAGLSVEEIYRRHAKPQGEQTRDAFVTPACEQYPEKLLHLSDPPLRLFYSGRSALELPQNVVGVVGSRRASNFGLRFARKLGEALSRRGIGVCSGLAQGIDGAVHQGVLDYLQRDPKGGPPVAVLGHGWGRVHPPEHTSLAERLCEHGYLLTEYPPGFGPTRWTFPARNRIIAGLSDHVVVVEAGAKSGSLYTADFAIQMGRSVWVVPTAQGRPNSQGLLRLWRDGAEALLDIEEFAETVAPSRVNPEAQKSCELKPHQQRVLALLKRSGGSTDLLCEECELSPMELACLLSELEMEGYLRRQIDGSWQLLQLLENL